VNLRPLRRSPSSRIFLAALISLSWVSGYWRPERSLLLVEGTEDLNRGEILGPRQSPLKLEAPAFRRGVVHSDQAGAEIIIHTCGATLRIVMNFFNECSCSWSVLFSFCSIDANMASCVALTAGIAAEKPERRPATTHAVSVAADSAAGWLYHHVTIS
jgi:hypothetical protein